MPKALRDTNYFCSWTTLPLKLSTCFSPPALTRRELSELVGRSPRCLFGNSPGKTLVRTNREGDDGTAVLDAVLVRS